MKADLPQRGTDKFGSGKYHAPRGERLHHGIDFACYPDTLIYPHIYGEVTKIGHPYSHDLSFHYVQVTDVNGSNLRYFYLNPLVKKGDRVGPDTTIGISQSLQKLYSGITDHVHFEIKSKDGAYMNPERYIESHM